MIEEICKQLNITPEELIIRELQQRINKVNQIIDELLLMGTNEYEIEEQLEYFKRVLGGKE